MKLVAAPRIGLALICATALTGFAQPEPPGPSTPTKEETPPQTSDAIAAKQSANTAATDGAETRAVGSAGPIYIVDFSSSSPPEQDLTMPLDPAGELCLDSTTRVVLASDRVLFELNGPNCFNIGQAEADAAAQEDRIAEAIEIAASRTERQAAQSARAEEERSARRRTRTARLSRARPAPVRSRPEELVVVSAEGGIAERLPRGTRILGDGSICLDEGDQVTVLTSNGTRQFVGPACIRSVSAPPVARTASRAPGSASAASAPPRAGASRRRATTPSSRPIVFRVSGGTEAVLEEYPRGTLVRRDDNICLDEGEQLNIAGSHGQRLTYSGPGCMERSARPTRDNIGGFTFGWNAFGLPIDQVSVP